MDIECVSDQAKNDTHHSQKTDKKNVTFYRRFALECEFRIGKKRERHGAGEADDVAYGLVVSKLMTDYRKNRPVY